MATDTQLREPPPPGPVGVRRTTQNSEMDRYVQTRAPFSSSKEDRMVHNGIMLALSTHRQLCLLNLTVTSTDYNYIVHIELLGKIFFSLEVQLDPYLGIACNRNI